MNNKTVEINLVPDVKQELIKANKLKNRVIAICLIIGITSIALVSFLAFTAFAGQKIISNLADKNIEREFNEFKNKQGVNQVLTVQNQLSKIDSLHDKKLITSRILNLIVALIDNDNKSVKISKIDFDSATNQLTIEAQSVDAYVALEKFQKTILATDIESKQSDQNEPVVNKLTDKVSILDIPTYGENTNQKKVLLFKLNFVINADFTSSKFKDNELVIKSINKKNVTDSYMAIPSNIFEKKAITEDEKENR